MTEKALVNAYSLDAHGLEQAHYMVVLESGFLEDCGSYRTYGLMSTQWSHEGWYIKSEIHDITTDLNTALDMASTFNGHQLSMLHFADVVEDWLTKG